MASSDHPVRSLRDDKRPEIAGYELAEVIGRGAAGVVYRGRQTTVDREVALKVLHDHHKNNPRLVRRMQREARTTARLAHPHVVSAVDMGEVDGRFWFAMEYVDGPSLALRLRQEGRLKEREALRLFIPLCEALEHLFEHGVVHRDIKPANILIDGRGGARIADLGLAFADSDPSITRQGSTLGTPHYISPEQAVNPTAADVRSDIWSFGATLFHTVCGRPPFSGDSAAEILSGVLYGRIPDPADLEPSLSRRLTLVLRKCLTREPAGRYQVPHELLMDLERVRERRAPKIKSRTLDPVQSRYDKRLTRWVAIGISAVVLAVAGLIAYRSFETGEARSVVTAGVLEPYGPLENLVVRVEGDEQPAEMLAALSDVLDGLPKEYRSRADEVQAVLHDYLRRRVRMVKDEMRREVTNMIRGRDLAGAWELLEEGLEKRLVEKTGFPSFELSANGVDIAPWRGQLVGELRSATDHVQLDLEKKLAELVERTLVSAEEMAARQDWRRAFESIQMGSPEIILELAGFGGFHLPPDLVDQLVVPVGIPLGLERQRLTDRWIVVDRELKRFVETRADTLEKQLADGPLRIEAGAQLEEDFEAELFDRGLSRLRMPDGLPKTAFTTLARRARFLREEEGRLLEEDARAVFDDTERLAGTYLRERGYEKARDLWQEVTDDLNSELRARGSAWRAELLRRLQVRREGTRLLTALLVRVSDRIIQLDGQTVSFLVGRVEVPAVRVQAGFDPLGEGFYVQGAGLSEKQDLRSLPGAQLERFAGFKNLGDLEPLERLTLALFRYYEGKPRAASETLNSGPLPDEGAEVDLVFSLSGRIATGLESEQERADAHLAEAERRLKIVFDERRQEQSPNQVIARIFELLRNYTDVPLVRLRRGDLIELRQRLENPDGISEEALFERQFSATSVHFIGRDRVRMVFDFQTQSAGRWDWGAWVFDNIGAVLESDVSSWDEILQRRGPRLILRDPFLPDEPFELVLVIEQLASSGPPQLLWISAAGFQVAFAGPGLPGNRRDARYLIGSEDPAGFRARLRGGEGEGQARLLRSGVTHRITIRGNRRVGRLEVILDGRELVNTKGLRTDMDTRLIELRSFEPVRLVRVELEGGR